MAEKGGVRDDSPAADEDAVVPSEDAVDEAPEPVEEPEAEPEPELPPPPVDAGPVVAIQSEPFDQETRATVGRDGYLGVNFGVHEQHVRNAWLVEAPSAPAVTQPVGIGVARVSFTDLRSLAGRQVTVRVRTV